MLRTFGVLFGKSVGGFSRRAHEIVAGELDASPEMRTAIATLVQARAALVERIKDLDRQVRESGLARKSHRMECKES